MHIRNTSWGFQANSKDMHKKVFLRRWAMRDMNPVKGVKGDTWMGLKGQVVGEGNGNPLQCSCLENLRDRGDWKAAVHAVAQSQTRLKRLSSSSSSSSVWLNFPAFTSQLKMCMKMCIKILWQGLAFTTMYFRWQENHAATFVWERTGVLTLPSYRYRNQV